MMNIKNKLLIIVACLGISTSSASTITEWSHNGSVMTTSWTDTTIKILYKEPRKEMQDAGARSGSVLVEGIITGDDIKGTAKIFAGRCGSFTYPVQGKFSHDNRKISLKGFAPVVDRSNCKTLRTVTDLLEFNYIDIKQDHAVSTSKSTVSDSQVKLEPFFNKKNGFWVQSQKNISTSNLTCNKLLGWVGNPEQSLVNFIKIEPALFSSYSRFPESSMVREIVKSSGQELRGWAKSLNVENFHAKVLRINNIVASDNQIIFDLFIQNPHNKSIIGSRYSWNRNLDTLTSKGACLECSGCSQAQLAACSSPSETEYLWCKGNVPDDWSRRIFNKNNSTVNKTVDYPNEDFYTGEMVNLIPQGLGSYWFSTSGELLTTQWREGRPIEGAKATLKFTRGVQAKEPPMDGFIKNGVFTNPLFMAQKKQAEADQAALDNIRGWLSHNSNETGPITQKLVQELGIRGLENLRKSYDSFQQDLLRIKDPKIKVDFQLLLDQVKKDFDLYGTYLESPGTSRANELLNEINKLTKDIEEAKKKSEIQSDADKKTLDQKARLDRERSMLVKHVSTLTGKSPDQFQGATIQDLQKIIDDAYTRLQPIN